MERLTMREQEVLSYIRQFMSLNGYAPSRREIGEGVYLNSPTTIQRHIGNLEHKGYIRHVPHVSRGIVLT